ncbi:Transcription factor mybs3 [Thalictrum thalictroides]|uniref:Transcription factor mybs3 n=2 Tax=Thalictrum thalictroides TaxID=46969 RepID=A0A7J6VL17_THATH|nr:Transcription factor mybs3 [Thalictrum thalictroides]
MPEEALNQLNLEGTTMINHEGTPWTEEEHRLFLLGLQKLGKGDWRGIARNFVISRTPTQVASHAQKYFIRQSNSTRRKRRSSLFDMVPEMSINTQTVPEEPHGMSQVSEDENVNELPNLHLSLDSLDRECEPMETTSHNNPVEAEEIMPYSDTAPIIPAFLPTYLPVSFPFWPPNLVPAEEEQGLETSHHQVLKPTAILSKDPVNVDELVCMSKLTLGAAVPDRIEPSPLSLKLVGSSSRQSAFHVNKPVSRSDLSKGDGNAIPAA